MDFELTLQNYSCSILCSIFMAIGLDTAWRISPIVCFYKGLRLATKITPPQPFSLITVITIFLTKMKSLVLINLECDVVGCRFILSKFQHLIRFPHTTINYKRCLLIKIKERRQLPCNGNALEGAGAGWLLPYRARILSVVSLFVAGLLCGWLKKFSSSAERCPNPALALTPVFTALILF